MKWSENDSFLKGTFHNIKKLTDPIRVASFDLDDTLIFRPNHRQADQKWKLIDPELPDKIAELVLNKYLIVVFTNQAGMSVTKNFNKKKWKKEINNLANVLFTKTKEKYYFAVYAAKKYDLYRKPNIGLWDQMKIDLEEMFNVNKVRISKKSFYCGDAAGRTMPSYYKKLNYPSSKTGDFSDTDRKFALNIGINFLTPEDLLLENSPEIPYKLSGIDPKKYLQEIENNPEYNFEPRKKEMIIMIASQGSGKTEFVKKYILPHKYVHISMDICKNKNKCIKKTKEAMDNDKSVVIDNTNPDILSRMLYTSLAKEYGYKHIRAIILDTNYELAKHLNNVRHVYSNGIIPKVTSIAYNIFKKNYVKPLKSEHFDKIETVNFSFDTNKLEDKLWKKIFMRYSEN
jgi:bifunctional polynucleotide phosphatase/kinase